MDRTLGADYVDIGGGKRGFRDQNRAAGVVGTEVNAAFLNGLQEEVLAVIESAGIEPNKDIWTQLLEAIDKKIEAVRVLLPIFPNTLTADGKFTVSQTGPGQISVAAGTTWIMRGGKSYTSALTPLNTAPSKLYHLRWIKDAGFQLFDIASLVYNPTALAEDNPAFDSSYDNMLVARVITDVSNVATITPLVNRPKLAILQNKRIVTPGALNWTVRSGTSITLNWARTPERAAASLSEIRSFNNGPDGTITPVDKGIVRNVGVRVSDSAPPTRYQVNDFEYYYEDTMVGTSTEDGLIRVLLTAEAA